LPAAYIVYFMPGFTCARVNKYIPFQ